jgi:hypothetical protein
MDRSGDFIVTMGREKTVVFKCKIYAVTASVGIAALYVATSGVAPEEATQPRPHSWTAFLFLWLLAMAWLAGLYAYRRRIVFSNRQRTIEIASGIGRLFFMQNYSYDDCRGIRLRTATRPCRNAWEKVLSGRARGCRLELYGRHAIWLGSLSDRDEAEALAGKMRDYTGLEVQNELPSGPLPAMKS